MINKLARLGTVLLLAAGVASADPFTLQDRGDGPHGRAFRTVAGKGGLAPRGWTCLAEAQAPRLEQAINLCAVDYPALPKRERAASKPVSPDRTFRLFAEFDGLPRPPLGTEFEDDTVDLTPNPEPGSLLLAGAGLMALYLLRRRRQQG
jgi:hypothetical protein